MCKVASVRKMQVEMIANTPSGMYYNFIIASNNSTEKGYFDYCFSWNDICFHIPSC